MGKLNRIYIGTLKNNLLLLLCVAKQCSLQPFKLPSHQATEKLQFNFVLTENHGETFAICHQCLTKIQEYVYKRTTLSPYISKGEELKTGITRKQIALEKFNHLLVI